MKSTVLRATVELWAILHCEQEWLQQATDSLTWMCQQHAAAGTTEPPWRNWEGAVQYIRHNPTGWKSAVRKAKRIAWKLSSSSTVVFSCVRASRASCEG